MNKLFIDDLRFAPDESWDVARTFQQAKKMLATDSYDMVSFDHDLGLPETSTGYKLLCWLEQEIFHRRLRGPKFLLIHSANPVGRDKMKQAIAKIQILQDREEQ